MPRTALLLLVFVACLASGCGNRERETQAGYGEAGREPSQVSTADPTNTAVNERDRNDAYPTPDDQMANEPDTKLTQSIRQAIMADESLSIAAQNVKIITVNGFVTLRGPVKTAAEKTAVATMAEQLAGATHVDNQLEVATD